MAMTSVVLFFALCLTGAVAQTTQSPLSCYVDALIDFATNNADCAKKFLPVVDQQVSKLHIIRVCTCTCINHSN